MNNFLHTGTNIKTALTLVMLSVVPNSVNIPDHKVGPSDKFFILQCVHGSAFCTLVLLLFSIV